jgi:hypothetical protein
LIASGSNHHQLELLFFVFFFFLLLLFLTATQLDDDIVLLPIFTELILMVPAPIHSRREKDFSLVPDVLPKFVLLASLSVFSLLFSPALASASEADVVQLVSEASGDDGALTPELRMLLLMLLD